MLAFLNIMMYIYKFEQEIFKGIDLIKSFLKMNLLTNENDKFMAKT